jgi:hypothetical protein
MKKGMFLAAVLLFGVSDGMNLLGIRAESRFFAERHPEDVSRMLIIAVRGGAEEVAGIRNGFGKARDELRQAYQAFATAERRAARTSRIARAAGVRVRVAREDEEKKMAAAAKASGREGQFMQLPDFEEPFTQIKVARMSVAFAKGLKKGNARSDTTKTTTAVARKATAERIKAEEVAFLATVDADIADLERDNAQEDAVRALLSFRGNQAMEDLFSNRELILQLNPGLL